MDMVKDEAAKGTPSNLHVDKTYYAAVKELGFMENQGRNIYYGSGTNLNTRFNFHSGEGFHFQRENMNLMFPEVLIMENQERILEQVKQEEYIDFFPTLAKLSEQKESELIFALTLLCLKEDALIYRILAGIPAKKSKTRRKVSSSGKPSLS